MEQQRKSHLPHDQHAAIGKGTHEGSRSGPLRSRRSQQTDPSEEEFPNTRVERDTSNGKLPVINFNHSKYTFLISDQQDANKRLTEVGEMHFSSQPRKSFGADAIDSKPNQRASENLKNDEIDTLKRKLRAQEDQHSLEKSSLKKQLDDALIKNMVNTLR